MRYACLTPLFLLLSACEPTQFSGGTALPDGSVYKGDLQDGLFHGQGLLQWPDGNHYRGEFRLGHISGQGLFTEADGCVYEGEFLNGVRHGEGRYTCGENTWSGRFSEGGLQKGKVKWGDGELYRGEFLGLEPHGEGALTTEEGNHYKGTFEQGMLLHGSYSDKEGYSYTGDFEYNFYSGTGELTQPDGTIIRANFRYGKADGEGQRVRIDTDGNTIEEPGYFAKGNYFPNKAAWRAQKEIPAAQVETRLYSESERLTNAIHTLASQRPGVRDVYTLLVGGDGTSPVFARELNWVAERLDEAFDIDERVLRLSNGGGYRFPLATRTSIQDGLNALDQLLDPQEDLLFVHIVSHGARNGDLTIAEGKMPLIDLSVADAKRWLDNLNAQYQWVVISACYSGQWIEPLSTPNRIVFTSAADDRTSFGCSDDSQRTWFSSALYGHALLQGIKDPENWFRAANKKVTEMEKEQGIKGNAHSLPQHSVGENFLRWWKGNE
ncbi:C13 family peptidase [uncultured Microbulbifer sp.]|uniref:C13 family peptidase n=1 Tax=uncultured Microbulbifer sp. TaxID=348147 RepID=UPI00261E7E33|nr:C13 family peptidase [uncultured Microbulbifer sp.]